MFQKIKSILSKGNRAQWFLFALFALTIFLQCCLFHWLAFHSILISSLWKNPMAFWAFYLPKISISLFIASFVFLFRRKGWTIVVSILINIWIIAELIYFILAHNTKAVYTLFTKAAKETAKYGNFPCFPLPVPLILV